MAETEYLDIEIRIFLQADMGIRKLHDLESSAIIELQIHVSLAMMDKTA